MSATVLEIPATTIEREEMDSTEDLFNVKLEDDVNDEDYELPEEKPLVERHRFQCAICEKVLKSKQAFNSHKQVHQDPADRPVHRCELCPNRTFKTKLGLKYHLDKHSETEPKKLPCPTCGRIFKSEEGRKIHMIIQHGAEGTTFKCAECPMVFARKPHLQLHMTTHGSGLHVCSMCGKSYARIINLRDHEAICGAKELCCEICNIQFRKPNQLEKHRQRMHLNRENRCVQCGQGFETEQALNSHAAVHRRSFHCEHCALLFVSEKALQHHLMCKHWETLGVEQVAENRGRPRKDGYGQTKVRKRRSKYDMFIGLEHLADPTFGEKVTPEEESTSKIEIKFEAEELKTKFQCEHCPKQFVARKALQNHEQLRHWEILGIEKGIEKRGRKRQIGSKKPKQRKKVRKIDPELVLVSADTEVKEDLCESFDSEQPEDHNETQSVGNDTEPCTDDVLQPDLVESYQLKPLNIVLERIEFFSEPVEKRTVSVKLEQSYQPDVLSDVDDGFEPFEGLPDDFDSMEEPIIKQEPIELELIIEEENGAVDDGILEGEPFVAGEMNEEEIFKEIEIKIESLQVEEPARKKRPRKPRSKNPFPRKTCEDCGKTFAYKFRLAVHRVEVHGSKEIPQTTRGTPKTTLGPMPRNFHCTHCSKSYTNQRHLTTHLVMFHNIGEMPSLENRPRNHSCTICKKCFTNFKGLLHHIRHVHDQKLEESEFVQCPSCRVRFLNADEMTRHLCMKGIVRYVEKPFQCDVCERKFAHKSHMEGHKSSHPEYQRVKCDVEGCPKGFFNEREMKAHKKRIHTTANHECKECGALFKTYPNMRKHAEIHADNTYFCEHCGKSFKKRIGLSSHMYASHPEHVSKVAVANREAPCDICGKKFKGKSSLMSHIRKVHNNIRKYQCSYCDKKFNTNACKTVHEQSHTKNYRFKCRFCDYGCVHRTRLRDHEQREHNSILVDDQPHE